MHDGFFFNNNQIFINKRIFFLIKNNLMYFLGEYFR